MVDLKKFRKDFKITQQDIASLFGCLPSNISMIEKNGRLTDVQINILISKYGKETINKYEVDNSLNIQNSEIVLLENRIEELKHLIEDKNIQINDLKERIIELKDMLSLVKEDNKRISKELNSLKTDSIKQTIHSKPIKTVRGV
jgi:transcriptional regulator with XRE-family HTH domain